MYFAWEAQWPRVRIYRDSRSVVMVWQAGQRPGRIKD